MRMYKIYQYDILILMSKPHWMGPRMSIAKWAPHTAACHVLRQLLVEDQEAKKAARRRWIRGFAPLYH